MTRKLHDSRLSVAMDGWEPPRDEESTRYFDAVSSTYFHRYHEPSPAGHALRARKQRVLELLEGGKGKVLDVGCGPGVMVSDLLRVGYEVWGIDESIPMIQQCQKHFGKCERAHFVVGNASRLPFPDEFFETVTCMGVLPNVQSSRAALKEFLRVVKRNGTLVISFPNFLSPYATWKIAVFYPALALLRPIYHLLTARRQAAALYNVGWYRRRRGLHSVFKELRTAHAATQVFSGLGAKITDIVYFNFNIFLSPLDELIPRRALRVTKCLESLRFGKLKWLGAGFILKAQKASDGPTFTTPLKSQT